MSGWFAKIGAMLVGGNVAEPVEAVGNALDKLFTSDDERAAAAAVMEKIRQKPHILQAEINKLEAQHRSIFVAGWRPAIGWVCAVSLSFPFIINPVIQWVAKFKCISVTEAEAVACVALAAGPDLPVQSLMSLVIALLGLGGLRTVEKVIGKAK